MALQTILPNYYTNTMVPLGSADRWMNATSVFVAATENIQQEAVSKVSALMSSYISSPILLRIPPPGVFPSLTNFFNQCTVALDGSNLVGDAKTTYIKILTQVDAAIEGRGIVRVYGRARATAEKVYVSEKFASDHLCKSKADAKNTAKGRLYRANPAPASTAIDKGSYMDGLNTYVKSMNDAGVFNAVTYYMKTKFNWNPEGSSVDSVIYLAPTKIMATTYRPKPNGAATQAMNEAQQEGHLAFSVQEDSSVPGRYLLYHYHDIVAPANVGTPANFKAPQNGNWVALTANAVVEMLQGLNTGGRGKVSTEDVAKIRAAYYHVYYAKV